MVKTTQELEENKKRTVKWLHWAISETDTALYYNPMPQTSCRCISSIWRIDLLLDFGLPLKTNILNSLPSESKVSLSTNFCRYNSCLKEMNRDCQKKKKDSLFLKCNKFINYPTQISRRIFMPNPITPKNLDTHLKLSRYSINFES